MVFGLVEEDGQEVEAMGDGDGFYDGALDGFLADFEEVFLGVGSGHSAKQEENLYLFIYFPESIIFLLFFLKIHKIKSG